MKRKKLISSVLILSLLITTVLTPTLVSSESIQDKINKAANAKKAALEDIEAAKKKKNSVLNEQAALDEQINGLTAEIGAIDDIISENNKIIAEKEAEIADYENKISENEELFRKRLRAMDETNVGNYVDLLMSSTSFSDFTERIETLHEISSHDKELIQKMTKLKNGIVEYKNKVVTARDEQQQAKTIVVDKKNQLDKKLSEKESLQRQLENDIDANEKVYKEATELENKLKESLKKSLSSSGSPAFTGGALQWPSVSSNITSPFGYRVHPIYGNTRYHSGVDIGASYGSSIFAAESGTVTMSGWNGGYGNCIVIDHGNGMATLYGHCSSISVSRGQSISRGQVIGLVGSTGNSTGPHLHFEVLRNGTPADPMGYVK